MGTLAARALTEMAKYISRRTVLQDIGRHGKKHCQNKFDNPQGSYQPKLDLMKQFRNQVDKTKFRADILQDGQLSI